MEKVSIIGSGNVGVAAAFYIAEKGFANIMLIDIMDGKAQGSALLILRTLKIQGS